MGKDRSLLSLLNGRSPVWFSLTHSTPFFVTKQSCSPQCQQNGLSWAKTLGDASRNGFKIVYTPIDLTSVTSPSLSYYVALLHKKLIGNEVFDTRTLAGSRLSSHFYSYCTRNISGAFTVMGINEGHDRLKVFAKMPSTFTGSEVHQYVLSVDQQSGAIQLNGECMDKNLEPQPIVRAKRPTKATTFTLPPLTIGFWVFPHANLRECITFPAQVQSNEQIMSNNKRSVKTSKELLLQQLIIETINKSAVGETKPEANGRTKRHAVIKKDATLIEPLNNGVPIDDAVVQPVNLNRENADSVHARGRRFIMDTNRPRRNLVDILYREVDDVKRKNLFAPYKSRTTSILSGSSRAKRQISPGLAKLFQKFEAMKPRNLGFKPAAFNHKDKLAIPPIATVHDIYSPKSAELKVFRSSENRDMPTGNVYLELENDDQPSPDYVAYEGNAKPGQRQKQRPRPALADFDDGIPPNAPHDYYDHMTGEFSIPRPKSRPAMASRHGELMEADVFQRAQAQGGNQPTQVEQPVAPQHQMEFVVQELQPTWQKNHQSMQKARTNLQEFYINQHGQPIVIDSYPTKQQHYEDDDGFFRSNRRRRSIDATMNDQIESRLKKLSDKHVAAKAEVSRDDVEMQDYINNAVDKVNLLDKMLQIVDQLDRTKYDNSDAKYHKLSAEIKQLESFIFRKIPQIEKQFPTPQNRLSPADIRRKCKVMATALEQKCMRDEEQFEKTLFKREVQHATEDKTQKQKPLQKIVKKLFPKTAAAIAEKKMKKQHQLREKRSAVAKLDSNDGDDIESNHIEKAWGEDVPVIKPTFIQRENWSPLSPYRIEDADTEYYHEPEQQQKTAEEEVNYVKKAYERIRTQHIPSLVRSVSGVADRMVEAVKSRVSGWWKMIE